jgi:hypothetical protein
MPKTSRVNTPQERDDDRDVGHGHEHVQEVKRSTKPMVDQLHAQLIRNRIQRTQTRDYSRILRDSNIPAQWYKTPPASRSIYYYDRKQQRHAPAKPSSSFREYAHLQVWTSETDLFMAFDTFLEFLGATSTSSATLRR